MTYICTMQNEEKDIKPSYWWSVFANRCPRCRRGPLFKVANPYKLKTTTDMHENCPVCDQPTDIEVGFYYGTSYVSYAVSVAISITTFLAWWVLIGLSINDNRVFWWLGINSFLLLALQPWMMQFSRTLWISWFVKYDPEWRLKKTDPLIEERRNKEQMGNW
jgi:hypothetical protein